MNATDQPVEMMDLNREKSLTIKGVIGLLICFLVGFAAVVLLLSTLI
jgi:hypothetical protein